MKPPLKRFVTDPVGQGPLEGAQHSAKGEHPICGDQLRFEAAPDPEGGWTLGFRARACPACVAVASLAVEAQRRGHPVDPDLLPALRQRIEELGGLASHEGHARILVEEVLERLFSALAPGP